MARRRHTDHPARGAALATAALIGFSASCGDGPAPTCRVAENHAVPNGLLASFPNARLDRAGAGFMLLGHDEARGEVRFASLSEAGALGAETAGLVPATRSAGPWYAVTAKAAPADQVLVLFGVPAATPTGAVALHLIVANAAGPALAPRPLLDFEGAPVILRAPPADAGPALAFGSSASGKRAVLTWADNPSATPTATPRVLLLGEDGTPQPVAPLEASAPFSCLAVTASRLDYGISRVIQPASPDDHPAWLFSEMDDAGNIAGGYNFAVFTKQMGCPRISPRPKGYTFVWQNRVGTYFADAENGPQGVFFHSNIVKGAVRFGGPDQQPPIACVASAGLDFSILYDAATPLLERHSRLGILQGGPLGLPIGRKIGGLSASARGEITFATYLDQGGSGTIRRLVKVECPGAEAPPAK